LDSLRDDWFTVLLESAGGGDPTLSHPRASPPTSDTAGDLTVTTDVAAGTLYAVLTTSATTPTEVQIAAGQDHTGAAAAWDDSDATPTAGANPFSATGLTGSTEYWPHFFHDTGAGDTITGTSDTDRRGAGCHSAGTKQPCRHRYRLNNGHGRRDYRRGQRHALRRRDHFGHGAQRCADQGGPGSHWLRCGVR
jgi:hypothetical protein